MEGHAKRKKITWKNDVSVLKRFVLSKLSGRLAVSLVAADLEAIHSEVGSAHPYAANDLLSIVRKMFNWGKVAGLIPRDYSRPEDHGGICLFPDAAATRRTLRPWSSCAGTRTTWVAGAV